MEETKIELKIIKMSEIQSQKVEWLWYPFIPYGKLTIVQGDPGDGKTTLVLNIAAKLSKGQGFEENMSMLIEKMDLSISDAFSVAITKVSDLSMWQMEKKTSQKEKDTSFAQTKKLYKIAESVIKTVSELVAK